MKVGHDPRKEFRQLEWEKVSIEQALESLHKCGYTIDATIKKTEDGEIVSLEVVMFSKKAYTHFVCYKSTAHIRLWEAVVAICEPDRTFMVEPELNIDYEYLRG